MPCSSLDSNLDLQSMGVNASMEEPEAEPIQNSNGKEFVAVEGTSDEEPYVGKEFESEEAAKVFYDAYATRVGFIMRVEAFRRSMRDGKVVWRRLVCNKEGFRKLRPRRSENRKPRAITREGCKAMIVVKKEKTGKWIVTRFVKEHNHQLVPIPVNGRRSMLLSQTPLELQTWKMVMDEKDVKIRELTAELQRERKRSAAIQEQLDMVLREMEEHSNHLSRNIDDIVQSVREIESNPVAHFKRQ
ncbi:protein FAR1-RELATED SEQUENCE 12 isoform X1 [Gossypium hirsutum]|uniref:Protein FAR1-RELATED SEQUENCE 12 isoform X1 n=1 Tax=Gossypium hirsutum TaxID=3635 RepID=A0A1U8NWS3_GOSHI|nr:protein FAR1-RELATED SEQUENCE 12 isoform X1 [Gossypium hirsutum]